MTPQDLKEYIYENDKVDFVLNEIGCHHIKLNKNKEYYSCGNVDGDNPSCILVFNDKYLNVINYTREEYFRKNSTFSPDIFTLVQYNLSRDNKNFDFSDAIKYLHKLFDLPITFKKEVKKEKKIDPLDVFKKVIRNSTPDYEDLADINEIEQMDYIPFIHIDLFKEGITQPTIDEFGLAYSNIHKRNIIPLRYWLDGKLLGYNMRTVVPNYDKFGIKKYFITPTYPKNQNLFGLWENKKYIQEKGYVVVYEAEKSVLKRHSRLDKTGVAISGHSLSNEQARILIGLNVDVIISMDKDVKLNEVRYMCEKLYGIRNVYYTYDKHDLLNPKDSIADAPKKIYDFIFKYKIKYDETEHKKYLKSLEEKEV